MGDTGFVGDGGAILALDCGEFSQINLTNDTIAGNTASGIGGGYYGTFCGGGGPNKREQAGGHAGCDTPRRGAVTNSSSTPSTPTRLTEAAAATSTRPTTPREPAQTIIAGGMSSGSPTTNCSFTDGGTLNSLGYNLIDDTTCGTAGTGDIIDQPAKSARSAPTVDRLTPSCRRRPARRWAACPRVCARAPG